MHRDIVLNAITIRGSIAGTRSDLRDSLQLAGQGKVKAIADLTASPGPAEKDCPVYF